MGRQRTLLGTAVAVMALAFSSLDAQRAASQLQLVWVDRTGKDIERIQEPGDYRGLDLSPDGTHLAVHRHEEEGGDVWVTDLGRNSTSRLTFGSSRHNSGPVWSPDGKRIVFASNRDGRWGLYAKRADGAGNEELLTESEARKVPMSWSPDGRFIVYSVGDGHEWVLPVSGGRKPFPILRTRFGESHPQISPDGKWVSLALSDETGKPEIYIASFPDGAKKWQVSTDGGVLPRWRRDGRELYFLSDWSSGKMMAAEIAVSGSSVETGTPRELFDSGYINLSHPDGSYHGYAVSPDGQRFLIPRPAHVSRAQSVLVLSLRTATSAQRCSNAQLDAEFFTSPTSVAASFAENSDHLVSVSGTVSGPHTIDIQGRSCNRTKWADAADSAAAAAGVNLAAYEFKFYMEPPETQSLCGFGGDARLNGSRGWIREDFCDSKHIIAYTLGEVFGAPYARSGDDFWGDASSTMGGYIHLDQPESLKLWNSLLHFNAPGTLGMGWLPPSNVKTVDTTGNYRVAVLDTASSNVQTLKIRGANVGSDYYYFSYRRAVGFSSDLRADYADKTSVTRWNSGTVTFLLANLADGQSFTDSSGLSVTQASHDTTYAYLAVSFSRVATKPR